MSNTLSATKKSRQKEGNHLMYIRQTTLFSFEQIMEFQQETKLELILSQIDVSKLSSVLGKPSHSKGANGYNASSLIYALLAMQILKVKKVNALVVMLKENPVLRYNCGFEVLSKVPSESTFSRFLNKLASCSELETLFHEMVIKAKNLGIVDGDHISIDSTKLDSYEASKPKKDIVDDGTNPNWGMKRDTNGNNIRWFGWKLHIICDSKSELPLDILVTPASIYDGTVAISMIDSFLKTYKNFFKPSYYAMDSGYDFEYIYEDIIKKYKAIPVIAYNPRGSLAPPEGLDQDFDPICSAGYKLVYWGKDGDYMKFRCPHAVGKCDCPHGMRWCSESNYGYTLKINCYENSRQYGYPLRSSTEWEKQYNKRTSVERLNSRLKEYLNLNSIRSKGILKVKVHALLNCIVLVAGSIVTNVKKQTIAA